MSATGVADDDEAEETDPAAKIRAANQTFRDERDAAFEDTLFTVITGATDRAKNAVTVLQGAATALLAIYTGLLGFVYSATGEALPLRAIITPVFLGLAVLLSTYYTSFVYPRVGDTTSGATLPTSTPRDLRMAERVDALVLYVGVLTQRRAWALRAAVVALSIGLVAIALPFVEGAPDNSAGETSAGSSSSETQPSDDADRDEWIGVELPATPPPTDWPVELRAVYLQAQLDDAAAEAAERRASAKSDEDDDVEPVSYIGSAEFTWAFIGVGLALVVLTGLVSWEEGRRRR